ncbi:hypothetical protein ACQ4PT_041687 [Festuca glaucescens]
MGIEVLEQKLGSHPLHMVCLVMTFQLRNVQCLLFISDPLLSLFLCLSLIKVTSNCHGTKKKAELNHEIQQLKSKMRDSQLQKFRDELKNRSRVLKMLGHIDADGVLQLKGRAACLIDTGDELLITELMFNGTFNDLDHHQVASVVSCFVPCEKSSEQIRLRNELSKPMTQLQEAARKIAEVQRECKLDVNVEEYVESTCKPYLMDVIYSWSKGSTFGEVIEMTDIF